MYTTSYADFSRLSTSTPQISFEPVDGTIELTSLSRERRYQILHPDNHRHRYDSMPRVSRATPKTPFISQVNSYLDTFLSVPLFNARPSVSLIKESEQMDEQTLSKTLLRIGDSYHASLQLLGLQFGTDMLCEPSEIANSSIGGSRRISLTTVNDGIKKEDSVAFETLPRNSNSQRSIIVEKGETCSPYMKYSEPCTKFECDGVSSEMTKNASHTFSRQPSINSAITTVSEVVKDSDRNASHSNEISPEPSISLSYPSMSSFVLFSLRVGSVYVRYGTSALYHEAVHSNRKPEGFLHTSIASQTNRGVKDRVIRSRYLPVTLYLPEYNLELVFMGSCGGCGTLRLVMIILINPVGCNRHMPDSYRAAHLTDNGGERENRGNEEFDDVPCSQKDSLYNSNDVSTLRPLYHQNSLFSSNKSLFLSSFAKGCRGHCASGSINQRNPTMYSLCSESAFLITDTLRHVFGNPTQEQFLTQYRFNSSRPTKSDYTENVHDHNTKQSSTGTFEWYTMDYDFEKMGRRSIISQSKQFNTQNWAASVNTAEYNSTDDSGASTSISIGAVVEDAATIPNPTYIRFFCKIPIKDAMKMRTPTLDDGVAINKNIFSQNLQLFSDRKSIDVLPSTSISIRAAMMVMMSRELAVREHIPLYEAAAVVKTQSMSGTSCDENADIDPKYTDNTDIVSDNKDLLDLIPSNYVFPHQQDDNDKEYTLRLLHSLSTMGLRNPLITNCYGIDETAANDAQQWILLPGIGAALVPSGHFLRLLETTPQDVVKLFGTPLAIVSDNARGRAQYDPLVVMKENNSRHSNENVSANRKMCHDDDANHEEVPQSREHLFDVHKVSHMEDDESRYSYYSKDNVGLASDHAKRCNYFDSTAKYTSDDCQFDADDAVTYLYPKVGIDLVFAGLPFKLSRIVVHNPIPLCESQFCCKTDNGLTHTGNSAAAAATRCSSRGTSCRSSNNFLLHFTNSVAILSTSAAYKRPYFSALMAPSLMSTPLIGWNPCYKQHSISQTSAETEEDAPVEILTPLTNWTTYGSFKASTLKCTRDLLKKQGTPPEKILFLLNCSKPLLVPEFTGYYRAYNGDGVDKGASRKGQYATGKVPLDGVSLHLIVSKSIKTPLPPRSSGGKHNMDEGCLNIPYSKKNGALFDDAYISKIVLTPSIKPENVHFEVSARGSHQDASTVSNIINPMGPRSNLIEMLLSPIVYNNSKQTHASNNEPSSITIAPVSRWYHILAPYISPSVGLHTSRGVGTDNPLSISSSACMDKKNPQLSTASSACVDKENPQLSTASSVCMDKENPQLSTSSSACVDKENPQLSTASSVCMDKENPQLSTASSACVDKENPQLSTASSPCVDKENPQLSTASSACVDKENPQLSTASSVCVDKENPQLSTASSVCVDKNNPQLSTASSACVNKENPQLSTASSACVDKDNTQLSTASSVCVDKENPQLSKGSSVCVDRNNRRLSTASSACLLSKGSSACLLSKASSVWVANDDRTVVLPSTARGDKKKTKKSPFSMSANRKSQRLYKPCSVSGNKKNPTLYSSSSMSIANDPPLSMSSSANVDNNNTA